MRKDLLLFFLTFVFVSQAQVSLVKDINPTGDGVAQYSNNRIEFEGNLIFAASEGSMATSTELWMSDGTENGTMLIKDIYFSNYSHNLPKSSKLFEEKPWFKQNE